MSEDSSQSKQPLEEVRQLIDKIPAEELEASLSRRNGGDEASSVTLSAYFSGPLPPPRLLQSYKDIDEGFANRIVEMAEKEQKHRHGTDERSQQSVGNFEKRGQLCTAAIVGMVIIGGTAATILGGNVYASLIFTIPLIGLAALLITGRRHDKKQKDRATLEND